MINFENFILGGKTFKSSPKGTLPPKNINPKAIPIWKDIVKKFRKDIKASDDLKKQWAIAIILFKRQCTSKSIMPFNLEEVDVTTKKNLEDLGPDYEVLDKAKRGAKTARSLFNKISKKLIKEGYMEPSLKSRWVFDRAIRADGRYHIGAYRRVRVNWDKSNEEFLRNLAMSHRFNKGFRNSFMTINNIVTLSFESDPKKKPADKTNDRITYAYITISITPKQAEVMTKQESGKKLESKLNRMGKGILLS